MKCLTSALIFISLVICCPNAKAQTVPTGFSVTNIATGWTNPVGGTFTKDGKKLFVWEKGGKVWVCIWNPSTSKYEKQSVPVLDISPEVGDWRDLGMLGFAVDPHFDNNGLIYLMYVVDRHYLLNFGTPNYNPATNEYFNATIGRITRYQTSTNGSNQVLADPASRFILLGESKTTGIPILYQSHGVGSLFFASDGTLIASAGDGASYSSTDIGSANETYYIQGLADGIIRPEENVGAFRSQMVNSLNGKILRIDPVTGNGVPSNPFYSAAAPRAPKSRVWAMGFRNPFRFTIKPNSGSTNPATGDIGEIYVGDVGYSTFEEMDIVEEKGTNFGWPLYEGQTTQPVYSTPNVVNRDEPNPLYGTGGCTQQYFYFKNLLKQATADGFRTLYNPCNNAIPIATQDSNRFFHHRPALDWRHGVASSRVGIFSGNAADTAEIGTAASGVAGTPFYGNCSIGGTWYTGNNFPPAYRNTYLLGDYGSNFIKRVTMKTSTSLSKIDPFATGFSGLVCVCQNPRDGSILCVDIASTNPVKLISYGGSQPPVVVMSADKHYGASNLTVNFSGSSSYDPEGAALTYAWDFGDGHTSTNPDPVNTFSGTPGVPKKFVIKLTVKDNLNLTATDSIIVSVNNTPPVVNITSPAKNSCYKIGPDTSYSLMASVTDAESTDGLLKYQWQTFLRHNNHEHAEEIDTERVTTTDISRIGCNGDSYYWLIKLTVTDDYGLATTDSSKIYPYCAPSTLPVTLTSLTVQAQGSSNMIKWSSGSEVYCLYYVLERSNDGVYFTTIQEQPMSGLPGIQSYSYGDDGYSLGTNFYRLKIVDPDGEIVYSKTVWIYNGAKTDYTLHIFPNPVSKEFNIGTSFPENGPVMIRVFDMNGKLVKQFKEIVSIGYQLIEINQLGDLLPGTYTLELIQQNNSRTARFVKIQ